MKKPMKKWISGSVKPEKIGLYEVRNSELMDRRYRGFLTGSKLRYWNGKKWMCDKPGSIFGNEVSIMGTHKTHQWRELEVMP